MLTKRIAEYLNALTGEDAIDDCSFYAEGFPAPKDITPHVVGVVSAGMSPSQQGRTLFTVRLRFIVSGSRTTAIEKAEEIYRYLHPAGIDGNRSFAAGEYAVFETIDQGEPVLSGNSGNVFRATFTIEFIVARDSDS